MTTYNVGYLAANLSSTSINRKQALALKQWRRPKSRLIKSRFENCPFTRPTTILILPTSPSNSRKRCLRFSYVASQAYCRSNRKDMTNQL